MKAVLRVIMANKEQAALRKTPAKVEYEQTEDPQEVIIYKKHNPLYTGRVYKPAEGMQSLRW